MIGIFLGIQDSGKTLSMTYYAYRYFKKGYKIFSNYNLEFEHEKLTKEILESYVKGKVQFENSIFIIDEIYLIMDSRSFGKTFNKLFSYFVLQTSKRSVHLFGTAQYFNTIDKRFRDNVNFMCYCQRMQQIGNNMYPVTDKIRILKHNNKLYIKNSFLIKDSFDGLFPTFANKNYYIRAEPCFKLYDTKELLGLE